MEPGGNVIALDDITGEWIAGTVVDRYVNPMSARGSIITVKLANGQLKEYDVPEDSDRDSAIHVKLVEPDKKLDVDDLTSLMILDEKAIVEALALRYKERKIYTKTGSILLAMNPFFSLQGILYGPKILMKYYECYTENYESKISLSPHVYAIAAEAYYNMTNPLTPEMHQNQAILISGESGAGKTESTKFLMEYLTFAGHRKNSKLNEEDLKNFFSNENDLAMKILKSNIVLESFGNSRTLRNDNSSRFGKFIKLHFFSGTNYGQLAGASIQTYLLEKVRIVYQAKGERNYHIFYEMFLGASEKELQKWLLMDINENENSNENRLTQYRYLNQSDCYRRKDSVQDSIMYIKVIEAMHVVGFSNNEKEGIFDLLASILHVGNLSFEDVANIQNSTSAGAALLFNCRKSLSHAASLLKLDPDVLIKSICTRKIQAGGEYLNVYLSAEQATNARDALAKILYSSLFEWLVEKINEFLKIDIIKGKNRAAANHFIGILDIFGFEAFPQNSFEQLCINFANEALQQQFNEYVFKLEQNEYESEGINWNYIFFVDNQDCVDLITAKHTGILSLVDEECLIPKGTDQSFVSKLYQRYEDKHPRFSVSRIQKVNGLFVITHYAGKVEYNSNGFLDKNKDQLHEEIMLLFSKSSIVCSSILKKKCASHSNNHNKSKKALKVVSSVGIQFKSQLAELLATIKETCPHYIRCIKPNDKNISDKYIPERVLQQLRSNGVIEVIEVARASYPIRLTNSEFLTRYKVLASRGLFSNIFIKMRKTRCDSNSSIRASRKKKKKDVKSTNDASYIHDIKLFLLEIIPTIESPELPPSLCDRPERLEFNDCHTVDEDKYAFLCNQVGIQQGKTKVFLRKITFEYLEKKKYINENNYRLIIHNFIFSRVSRKKYLMFLGALKILQQRFRYKKIYEELKKTISQKKKMKEYERVIEEKKKKEYEREMEERKKKEHERLFEEKKKMEREREKEKKKEADAAVKIQSVIKMYNCKNNFRKIKRRQKLPTDVKTKSNTVHMKTELSKPYNMATETKAGPTSSEATNEKLVNDIGMKKKEAEIENLDRSKDEIPLISPNVVVDTSKAHFNDKQQVPASRISLHSNSLPRVSRATRTISLPKLDTVKQTQWINDEDRFSCHNCNKRFSMFRRKHHCRSCGEIICSNCSQMHPIKNKNTRVCRACTVFHNVDITSSNKIVDSNIPESSFVNASKQQGIQAWDNKITSNEKASNEDFDVWNNAWPEPPMMEKEDERLATLRSLNIVSLKQEGIFSMFCDVAARTLKCPIAAVSLLEEEEEILISSLGMSKNVLPREISFCAHTIVEIEPLIVLDTQLDKRFTENPMVKGGQSGSVKLRFYAGSAIFAPNGYPIGTVSVFDTKPRKFVEQEHIAVLQNLSALASEKMMRNTFQQNNR